MEVATASDRMVRAETDGVRVWPLGARDLDTAARWLAEDRNQSWLDFGAGVASPSALTLRVMSRREQHSIWVYGPPGPKREPAGLVGLGQIQPRFQTAEVWCVLGEKEYGPRDLTVRAGAAVLEHGFRELGLRCIYAWTVEINRGGRRLLRRFGFREAGRLRGSHVVDGRRYDRIWYDLLSSEYHGFSDTW